MSRRLEPKIVAVLREGYSRTAFGRDVMAGLVVGVVALPLSIALAIASGVRPEQGLYTAIVAGFVISLLSGSRVQVGGPTGAFIVLVYSTVERFGYEGLATATLLAGGLLVLMGIAGLGAAIKFIPYPVTLGFTAGIAVIILTAQIRDFAGLDTPPLPADFVEKVRVYAEHAGSVHVPSLLLALASLAVLLLWPRVSRRVPGPMVVIVAATLATSLLGLPVETIGSRFGAMPTGLPAPALPSLRADLVVEVLPSALAIALLAGIESLLSAVVADGMTGRRHRSDMELVAQGAANCLSPLFLGIPATGAIARTATNVRSGGTSPVAGMVHAATLLAILLGLGRYAAQIPMPALAAVLVRVSLTMGEWSHFLRLFRAPRSDVLVLLTTFGLTVFVDLVVAIEVGVVLAALLFMRRMAEVSEVGFLGRELGNGDEEAGTSLPPEVPPDVEVFRIAGPFFFGAAERFRDAMRAVSRPPRVLILRMREVPVIDATGLRALEEVVDRALGQGTTVLFTGLHPRPRTLLERSGLLDRVGRDRVFPDIHAAVAWCREASPPAR
jgi:SulP family sulfate permease